MKEVWLGFTTLNSQIQTLIIILVVLLVIYLIKKGVLDLILKKFLGKKEIKADVKAHEVCPHFPSLVSMMRDAMYKNIKIYALKTQETVYDQMNIFENTLDDIIKIRKSNYLTLYKTEKKIKIDGILNHIQVKYYISLLKGSRDPLEAVVLKYMKENHFLEKSEIEFTVYKAERGEKILQEWNEYFDDEYDSDDFDVSREKLYLSDKACDDKIIAKLNLFFDKARMVSKENNKKIKKLEAEIKPFM